MMTIYQAGWRYLAACLFAQALTAAAHAEAPLTLETALTQALAANPGLQQRHEQAVASASLPQQAASLPDPWLTAEPGRADRSQLKLGITQVFPYPGKLSLAGEAARHAARAAHQQVAELALSLTAQVKQLWWRLFYLDRALEILRRNQGVMRRFISVAETRYRVGLGLQQEVLLAQLELSKLLESEIALAAERRVAEARLNALLYQAPATALELPAQVDTSLPVLRDEASLMDIAVQARPMLAAQRQQVQAAVTQVELARKDYRPDFMLGANYEWREGAADMKGVMFAMSLPRRSGSRQDRALDQRNAELLAQRYGLQDSEARLAAEVAAMRADYERAREQVRLLKGGILPQATQTVASMLSGYQVGKVDFLNLSQAQITLHDYETRYWLMVSEAHTALARLIATVGEEQVYE